MRTLEQARTGWEERERYKSVRDLKNAIRLENRSSAATRGLRSFCWKTFLLFDTLDLATCQQTLASSRAAYNTLRSHFLRSLENPAAVDSAFDPLSHDAETSPWTALRKDEELRAEILQDVERCMPEHKHFRDKEVQRMLLDILFVFCKLNPDVGYRQGMHELLAPILWVVQEDAIDFGENSKALGDDAALASMFDAEHIEHDAFALFGQVMQSSKAFYVSEGPDSIASRSRRIFDELLARVDPDLKKHLEHLEIVPQVYLIRWVRLLFGREFDFSSVLTLWDAIFAEDASLEVVDFICVAMLLRIRWELIDADYNWALNLLLRYPEPDRDFPAQTLAFDAMHLQSNLSVEDGSSLVLKYTGRPLLRGSRPVTPPALQRNITAFSGFATRRSNDGRTTLSPSRGPMQARNLEVMLRNTAKSIHAQGEKLGIGRAVRSAVEEVHRKAQEIRETQVSSPPSTWRRTKDQTDHTRPLARVKNLEVRNRRLSELLAGAVSELWDYHKLASEDVKTPNDKKREDAIENLSTAIAKVQFVQVYLEEPGLTLAEESAADLADPKQSESSQSQNAEVTGGNPSLMRDDAVSPEQSIMEGESTKEDLSSMNVQGLADPSSFEDFGESPEGKEQDMQTPEDKEVKGDTPTKPDAGETPPESLAAQTRPSRPPLAQSEFSFMLGQNEGAQREKATHPFESAGVPAKRDVAKSSLFGYGEDSRRSSSRVRPGNDQDAHTEQYEFDIGSLRRAPRAPK